LSVWALGVTVQDRQHDSHFAIRTISAFAVAIFAIALLSGTTAPSFAQNSGKSARKVVVSVKPEYPETLKFAQIGGLVRLAATVQANGTVTQVEIRGGNPILAEKAQAAVMKWKYAPGPTQTVEEISVSFSPH
jgi:TonB family protein